MKQGLFLLFLIINILGFSQKLNLSVKEKELISQTKRLDSLMQNNDVEILNLFSSDISFGHSNGWVQGFDDFKNDFESNRVKYQTINNIEIKDLKIRDNFARISRLIDVKGLYKGESFDLKLSVLEVWIYENEIWKLWSRQGVTQKIK